MLTFNDMSALFEFAVPDELSLYLHQVTRAYTRNRLALAMVDAVSDRSTGSDGENHQSYSGSSTGVFLDSEVRVVDLVSNNVGEGINSVVAAGPVTSLEYPLDLYAVFLEDYGSGFGTRDAASDKKLSLFYS